MAAGSIAGWVAAMGVTIVAPFIEWADDRPFFISRIFAMAALAATVLSVAWLIDRAKRPTIPVPAETTYKLGIEAGKRIARMEDAIARWNDPKSGPSRHPLAGELGEQQDTPPYMWRR